MIAANPRKQDKKTPEPWGLSKHDNVRIPPDLFLCKNLDVFKWNRRQGGAGHEPRGAQRAKAGRCPVTATLALGTGWHGHFLVVSTAQQVREKEAKMMKMRGGERRRGTWVRGEEAGVGVWAGGSGLPGKPGFN